MKLQKIIEINPILPFTEFDWMQKYRKGFESSELGRLHAMLPLKEMAEQLASAFPKKHPQGNTPMFPPEGGNRADVPQIYNTAAKSNRFGTQDKPNKNVIRTWATTQEKSIQRISRPK